MPSETERLVWTLHEAAEMTGLTLAELRAAGVRGEVHLLKLGRSRLVSKHELDRYLVWLAQQRAEEEEAQSEALRPHLDRDGWIFGRDLAKVIGMTFAELRELAPHLFAEHDGAIRRRTLVAALAKDATHLEELVERYQDRRSQIRGPLPAKIRRAVIERDGRVCGYCHGAIRPKGRLHVDHITPWSLGGRNDLWNLTVSCAACNGKKSAVRGYRLTCGHLTWEARYTLIPKEFRTRGGPTRDWCWCPKCNVSSEATEVSEPAESAA